VAVAVTLTAVFNGAELPGNGEVIAAVGTTVAVTTKETAAESPERPFESKARATRLTVPVVVGVHEIVYGAALLVPTRVLPA
jgi:hypothetical protein